VVTDSLFSMDGTWADLTGLAELRARRPFMLVIDEAHASLVVGPRCGAAHRRRMLLFKVQQSTLNVDLLRLNSITRVLGRRKKCTLPFWSADSSSGESAVTRVARAHVEGLDLCGVAAARCPGAIAVRIARP